MVRFKRIRVRPTTTTTGTTTSVVSAFAGALPDPAPAPVLTDLDGRNQHSGQAPAPVLPPPLLASDFSASVLQRGLVPSRTERRGLRPLINVFTYYFNLNKYKVLRAWLARDAGLSNGTPYVEGEGLIETDGDLPPEALTFSLSPRGELLVSGELADKFSLRDGFLYLKK
jgi:hypothetical protein